MNCDGCLKPISKNNLFLTCNKCKLSFHNNCLNISDTNFKKMATKKKSNWNCPKCKERSRSPSPSTDDEEEGRIDQIMKIVRRCLTSEFKEFNDKLNILPELKESINFISAEYVDLKKMFTESLSTIKSLQSENDQLKIEMRDLNARVTHFEQLARETNVEIQCVPEHKMENLASIVKILGTVISRPIADSEILAIHRVPKVKPDSSRPKSIIVKLPSLRARDEILAAVSSFNKKNKTNKLNSAHLGINGINGINSPVYVSEHLTPANKALHAATRIKAKEANYKFVWIRNGRILVRKDENTAHAMVIRNHDSLASLT